MSGKFWKDSKGKLHPVHDENCEQVHGTCSPARTAQTPTRAAGCGCGGHTPERSPDAKRFLAETAAECQQMLREVGKTLPPERLAHIYDLPTETRARLSVDVADATDADAPPNDILDFVNQFFAGRDATGRGNFADDYLEPEIARAGFDDGAALTTRRVINAARSVWRDDGGLHLRLTQEQQAANCRNL